MKKFKLSFFVKENFLKIWNTDFLRSESGLNVEIGIYKNVSKWLKKENKTNLIMALCHVKKLFIFFELPSEGCVGEIIQCLNSLWDTSGKKRQEKTKGGRGEAWGQEEKEQHRHHHHCHRSRCSGCGKNLSRCWIQTWVYLIILQLLSMLEIILIC